MSSPEEPHRPVPPQPGHEPSAGQPAPGQPPVPYYAAPARATRRRRGAPNYPRHPATRHTRDRRGTQLPATRRRRTSVRPYAGPVHRIRPAVLRRPGLPPPKKSRKALWIVLGIVGGVLLLVTCRRRRPAQRGGRSHQPGHGASLTSSPKLIIAGDVNTAYEKYLDPALMREAFAGGVRRRGAGPGAGQQLQTKLFTASTSAPSNGSNSADVAGTIDCDTKSVELVYRFEGHDELKMVNIRLRPAALTSEKLPCRSPRPTTEELPCCCTGAPLCWNRPAPVRPGPVTPCAGPSGW